MTKRERGRRRQFRCQRSALTARPGTTAADLCFVACQVDPDRGQRPDLCGPQADGDRHDDPRDPWLSSIVSFDAKRP